MPPPRIAANLARWPHDLWVRVHAGDALVALGEPEGAARHFKAALRMAEESDDFEATAEVIDRLQDGNPAVRRRAQRTRRPA